MIYDKYDSALGPLWLARDHRGLRWCGFSPMPGFTREAYAPEAFADVRVWLDAYFRGQPVPVTFELAPEGTAFQRLVWQLLEGIPFGEVRTYGELAEEAARMLGKQKMSPQAVGQALGRNPIALILPCHRVVGAGGALTGYAGTLERKAWLLHHEGWEG